MRLIAATVLGVLWTSNAIADDRFGADNPPFLTFETTCRIGLAIKAECKGSVIGAYAARTKTAIKDDACDFKVFWDTKDNKYNDRTFDVLPWQYGVEALVDEPGVCRQMQRVTTVAPKPASKVETN